jgi:alkylation response protein AidB-like acyl-CoA dehydrogenase
MNWRAMGMRGTGSNTVVLEGVFVPEEAVALKRPPTSSTRSGTWS